MNLPLIPDAADVNWHRCFAAQKQEAS